MQQDFPLKVMLVDDSSNREVLDKLLSELSGKILLRQVNFGSVSKSWNLICNEAFKKEQGNCALILNNDVALLPNTINPLLRFAQQNSRYGLVTGVEVAQAGEIMPAYTFSAFLIAKWLYETVGPFDENIVGQGLEDWDYVERLKERGLQIGVCKDFKFYHERSATMKVFPDKWNISVEYYRRKWGDGKHKLP
jgi:GT2 family glycosyltransferase